MKRTRLLSALTLVITQMIGCHYQTTKSPVAPVRTTVVTEPNDLPPAPDGAPTITAAMKQLAASPNSPVKHHVLAMAYYKKHKFSSAASEFEKASRLLPENTVVINMLYLGYSYEALNQPQKALAVYRQLLTHNLAPNDASDVDLAIANIYQSQADPVQAKVWLAKSIGQNPHQASALLGLGYISAFEEKQDEAMNFFQSAMKFADTNHSKAEAYAAIGKLLDEEKKPDAASHAYTQALALDRTNQLALQGLHRIKQ